MKTTSDVKVYGHFKNQKKRIDMRCLFDFDGIEAKTEKEAANKALKLHRTSSYKHYKPTVVECGGCRHYPGAGRIYFFKGNDPRDNYADGSKGELLTA